MSRTSSAPAALLIAPTDNVAVVLKDFIEGEVVAVEGHSVPCRERVASGHKVALLPIEEGARIIKCGVPVGIARRAIEKGEHVHIHNVSSAYITDH